jgi:hypothetical protein
MKISYGRFNYIPFESSWAVLLKASALNLMPAKMLIQKLARAPQYHNSARYWKACDIDDSKMAAALSLPYPAIKRAFIDNLVECTSCSSQLIIRHCSKCIAAGYHSVFFLLQMIKRCPWHGEPLEVCRHCSSVMVRGLLFARGQNGFCAKTHCDHFLFDSTGSIRLSGVTAGQWKKYEELGLRIEKWLNAANAMKNPLVNYAISLLSVAGVTNESSDNDEKLINIGLTLTASELGEFPAPGAISTWAVPPFEIVLAAYSPHEAAESEFRAKEIFTLYRCVRRYLYNAYVKPHGACFKYLMSLSRRCRHGLDCQHTCAVSAAFLVWCEALHYRFREGGPINLVMPSWHVRPATPRQIMVLWIMHFYAIWTGIVEKCTSCNQALDRFSVALSGNACLVLGVEVISISGVDHQLTSDLACLHVCPAWLSRQTNKRCWTRLSVSNQSNFRAYETVQYWTYVPDPATFLRFWYGNFVKSARSSPFVAAG